MTQLFSSADMSLSQTDQFVVPPATSGPDYPNQWHLTAQVSNQPASRWLAVIQVGQGGDSPSIIRREGDTFEIGEWTVTASLDPASAPRLEVRHRIEPVVFSYGDEPVEISGTLYQRQTSGSSVLYDESDGEYRVTEMSDRLPISTRAGF